MATKSELLALLRESATALEAALYGDEKSAPKTLDNIHNALRAEAALGADGDCPVCGEAITQPATGRPRTYCGSACKTRAYRSRRTG
jgi:hypothetical protein